MARQRPKSTVILDWVNVSYRSVFLAVILVLLAGAVAGWWWWSSRDALRDEAREAVARAEQRVEEAAALPGDERLDEARDGARAALAEARGALDRAEYEEARIAAIRAENLAQKAIDMARGEGSSHSVRFYRLEGDVRVKRQGQFAWDPADRKTVLRIGDQVKTSSSASAQLIYFDGTITTIRPGSLLEISELSEDPATLVRRVSERLNWGEVTASTQKRNVEGSFHEVSTESVRARTDQPGEFRVAVDREEQTSSFDVFEGRVEVAGAGARESLEAGQRIRASAQGRLAGKEALPGVPRLVAPSDQRVFVHDDPALETTALSWEKVPGAARYHLRISDKMLFTSALYDAPVSGTAVAIEAVPTGTYFWRVAAISGDGVEGPSSEVRSFRVTSQRIRDSADVTPPRLEIDPLVQTGPMVIINGRTEPGALVWVNGEKVDVYEDGSFYAVLRLRKEGVNELLFEAQDAAGNRSKETRRAFVETY